MPRVRGRAERRRAGGGLSPATPGYPAPSPAASFPLSPARRRGYWRSPARRTNPERNSLYISRLTPLRLPIGARTLIGGVAVGHAGTVTPY